MTRSPVPFATRFATRPALLLAAALALAACQSSEERAEGHFQSALGHMAEGEVELALVELRRVFDEDGFHKEARALYAATVRARGNLDEAYGQYLRLIEQYPDTPEARIALGEMAFGRQNWEEVERHGTVALELVPEDPAARALGAALDYRAAALEEDRDGMDAAAAAAAGVLDEAPENEIARRLLISHLLSGDDPTAALPEIDRILEADPDDLQLHFARLNLLGQMQDEAGVEAQLARMFELFPDNPDVQRGYLRWHIARGETDEAEALLRAIAERTPEAPEGYLTVVRFLQESKGDEAALAELAALTEAAEGTPRADLYRAMTASMTFDQGAREDALAQMRAILETAEPSDQTRDIQVMLARMLIATGDVPAARALVEEVVAADDSHVEALKLRAGWAIEEDRAGEAIADLRAALDQAPRDPEILTLMASAHARDGSRELAGERLALAVEASGAAVPESLRYARFLLAEDRIAPARQVITDALRGAPDNLELLGVLSEIALREEDWATVADLRARLETREEPEARVIAQTLETARLLSDDRLEETFSLLEGRIEAGGEEGRSAAALRVLLLAREGDIPAARAALGELLAEDPQDLPLRQLDVALDFADQDLEGAEAKLRAMLEDFPGAVEPARQLFTLLRAQGRGEEATALVEQELEARPESRYLRLLEGALKSEEAEIDESIATFEELYAENSGDLVVANNLASMLATHRADDPAEVERAANIARRLRGREVPAFQDTYGWIAFLRGDLEEALAHLEPAAEGLPGDPLVQYHLARVYEALERIPEARAQYARALELAEGRPVASLPQFEIARTRLAELPEAPEADAGEATATE